MVELIKFKDSSNELNLLLPFSELQACILREPCHDWAYMYVCYLNSIFTCKLTLFYCIVGKMMDQ